MTAAPRIPEIASALAEFIINPEPYSVGLEPAVNLRAIAAELQILPVCLDMGGCLGLLASGEVASFLWDEPHLLRPESNARIRNIVFYRAGLKYPALVGLVPDRPLDAVKCPSCGGLGRCSDLPASLVDRVVCSCGGLG